MLTTRDSLGRVSSPQFVGRSDQLSTLSAAFEAASGGRSTTVLISGEAGVGKTRLVDEFCQRVRADGALVASGACVPTDGGGLPYGPVVGIVRDVLRQPDGGPDVLGPVAQLLGLDDGPVRATSDGEGPAAAGSPPPARVPEHLDGVARTRLFESILNAITRLSQRSPVVLVFEDLHWADSASGELLDFLTRNLVDAKTMIVGTYRSDELMRDQPVHARLAELSRHPRAVSVRLEGLDRAEMSSLIGGILGEEPGWTLVDAVFTRSQGNPFFAEELTASRDNASLSPELQGVILTRVESLSKHAQQVLRVASVAGPTVTHELLVAVGVLPAHVLDDAVAEIVDKNIMVVDLDIAGYAFRHALLREAVYAKLLPGERGRLHRDLAKTLTADAGLGASGPGHRAAELANHWWAAGDWPEAFDASVAAGDVALAIWALPEAHAHFEHALAALGRLPAVPPGVDETELFLKAANVAYLTGAGERAVELATTAAAGADDRGDVDLIARVHLQLGRNLWDVGQAKRAFMAYRRASEVLAAQGATPIAARIMAEEARLLMLMSRYSEADRRGLEALALARSSGDRLVEAHVLSTLGACRANRGYIDEAIELHRTSIAIATELGSLEDINRGYNNFSCALLDGGRPAEAAGLIYESMAAGARLGFDRLNQVAANSAEALIRLGQFNEAEALLELAGEPGMGICGIAASLPVSIAILRGRFDEATTLMQPLADATQDRIDINSQSTYHVSIAQLALEQGRPADAVAAVAAARAMNPETEDGPCANEMCAIGVRALADLATGARTHGRRVDVDALRAQAAAIVDDARMMATPTEDAHLVLQRTTGFAATCEAEFSRFSTSDPALWAAVVSIWDDANEVYLSAYARWRQAEALLASRTGRHEATQCLQAAWAVCVAAGALPLQTQIEELASRARVELRSLDLAPPRSTVGDDLGLTPREVEILGQLALGRTDREIAEALFISKKTASVHVSNVLHKLDVTNRVEAGRVGQAHGLRGAEAAAG
jgi:DNA-binding NarL/FixJ family response regulator